MILELIKWIKFKRQEKEKKFFWRKLKREIENAEEELDSWNICDGYGCLFTYVTGEVKSLPEFKEIKISENGDIFIKMAENKKTITLSDNGFNGIYSLFFLKKEERKRKEKRKEERKELEAIKSFLLKKERF
jgi:hypothetical protein